MTRAGRRVLSVFVLACAGTMTGCELLVQVDSNQVPVPVVADSAAPVDANDAGSQVDTPDTSVDVAGDAPDTGAHDAADVEVRSDAAGDANDGASDDANDGASDAPLEPGDSGN